jgi:hypothetical protein
VLYPMAASNAGAGGPDRPPAPDSPCAYWVGMSPVK